MERISVYLSVSYTDKGTLRRIRPPTEVSWPNRCHIYRVAHPPVGLLPIHIVHTIRYLHPPVGLLPIRIVYITRYTHPPVGLLPIHIVYITRYSQVSSLPRCSSYQPALRNRTPSNHQICLLISLPRKDGMNRATGVSYDTVWMWIMIVWLSSNPMQSMSYCWLILKKYLVAYTECLKKRGAKNIAWHSHCGEHSGWWYGM